jgi:hypothetical protein
MRNNPRVLIGIAEGHAMLQIPDRSLLDQQAKSNDIRFSLSVAIVTIGAAVLFWLIADFYHSGLSNVVLMAPFP